MRVIVQIYRMSPKALRWITSISSDRINFAIVFERVQRYTTRRSCIDKRDIARVSRTDFRKHISAIKVANTTLSNLSYRGNCVRVSKIYVRSLFSLVREIDVDRNIRVLFRFPVIRKHIACVKVSKAEKRVILCTRCLFRTWKKCLFFAFCVIN